MRHLLSDRTGSMFVYTLVILIFLFTLSGLVGEIYRVYSIQSGVEYEIQRAVNIAVEDAMKDSWRQDKQGYLDTATAMQTLNAYFSDSLGLNAAMEKHNGGDFIYTLKLDSVTPTENPPRLQIRGELIVPGRFPVLVSDVKVPFNITSRNGRTD